MNQMRPINGDNHELQFPSVNIYCSPRVHQQKINNKKAPLCKYKQKVTANNARKYYDHIVPDKGHLEALTQQDGMIYMLKNMIRNIGHIQVLICVCMYNESKHAINQTLTGIYDNLPYFEAINIPCQDIAVILIQDGILKLVKDKVKRTFGKDSMVQFYRTMDQKEGKPKCALEQRINLILDEMDNLGRKGIDDLIAKNSNFPPTIQKNIALLYQNQWNPLKTFYEGTKQDGTPIQKPQQSFCTRKLNIFSCFKHLNGTKLSSHLWYFQGFCRYLEPQYCVLLDVGTKPEQNGLVNLIKGFSAGSNIGGVTGLMSVDSEFKSEEGDNNDENESNWFVQNFLSIQKAQQYEYIIAHFLDKNAQSALGFLHVLPGAWSAYLYQALIKSQKYQPNLLEKSYFKMILNPELQQKDYEQANMYLAEDRILSLGIYCQMRKNYILKYVPDAIAKTDPMKDHQNLMNQRRRWINSSLFAFMYVWRNYSFNVEQSNHNFFRKYVLLSISMLLAALSFLNSYLTPSIYFFVLYVTIKQIDVDSQEISITATIVSLLYVLIFLGAVAGSLTGKNWSKRAHLISGVLSVFTFFLLGLVIYNLLVIYLGITQNTFDLSNTFILLVLIMSIINIASFLLILVVHIPQHAQYVWKLVKDQISYIAYQGAYSQTMVIHAFCNVDDVSWGTKGSSSTGVKKYENSKVFFVSSWLFYNCLVAYIFIYVDIISPRIKEENGEQVKGGVVLIAVTVYATSIIFTKTMLALGYYIKWLCCQRCCLKMNISDERKNKMSRFWNDSLENFRSKYHSNGSNIHL